MSFVEVLNSKASYGIKAWLKDLVAGKKRLKDSMIMKEVKKGQLQSWELNLVVLILIYKTTTSYTKQDGERVAQEHANGTTI